MATISLCMIVQDEEACVVEGLYANNLIDYVDEIVILDGGSVDRTKEIVAAIPKVKLYEFPFDRHFANQKNRCLEKAECEWILFKDADESFEPDVMANLQRLTAFMPYMEYDAFAFARKTYIDGCLNNLGADDGHDYQVRYWKHRKGIHYDGVIHEGVTGFDKMMKLNVWIIHRKTGEMQQKDNELYWRMGQDMPEHWRYDETEDKFYHEPPQTPMVMHGIPVEDIDGLGGIE